MAKKYVLTEDYKSSESAKAGAIVYLATKADYGLARDDTYATGVEHVSVTLNPEGDYPSFTYPRHLLQEEGVKMSDTHLAQTIAPAQNLIGGKVFAGAMSNARPFFGFGTTKDRRTIKGYLHVDHKNRGFDRGDVRTSIVEDLIIHEGAIYAITMNSAYRLDTVSLLPFISSEAWRDDFLKLIALATLVGEENKID